MEDERILAIRLGALGDLVLCFPAFQSLRDAFPKAKIALLTMPAFADFASKMPWFDEVLIDPRLPRWRLDGWYRLVRTVRRLAPTRVFDFQNKSRQANLFWLLGGPYFGPFWSGAAKGCASERPWPPAEGMSCALSLLAQLEKAGVSRAEKVNLSWLDADVTRFGLTGPYALLVPGCSPEHPYKRWPVSSYVSLANTLRERGLGVVCIGTKHEADVLDAIAKEAPGIVNLSGRTDLLEVAGLARRAKFVIGNDTGPMHLAASVGAKTLALLSEKTNPSWSAPYGPHVSWLQGKPIARLEVGSVLSKLEELE